MCGPPTSDSIQKIQPALEMLQARQDHHHMVADRVQSYVRQTRSARHSIQSHLTASGMAVGRPRRGCDRLDGPVNPPARPPRPLSRAEGCSRKRLPRALDRCRPDVPFDKSVLCPRHCHGDGPYHSTNSPGRIACDDAPDSPAGERGSRTSCRLQARCAATAVMARQITSMYVCSRLRQKKAQLHARASLCLSRSRPPALYSTQRPFQPPLARPHSARHRAEAREKLDRAERHSRRRHVHRGRCKTGQAGKPGGASAQHDSRLTDKHGQSDGMPNGPKKPMRRTQSGHRPRTPRPARRLDPPMSCWVTSPFPRGDWPPRRGRAAVQ